ncbi:uncharacterized protein [Dysidea avara]|uniref:uncharacterized protein isoform X2 n=1 Tax=Dysidea avara TaxID=196820 RepID=UPI0033224DF0
MTLGRLLVAILIELGLYVGALERGETVDCLIDFNIYISQDGQFCNGTDHVDGSLTHPVYFQYKTGIDWTTLGSYNESILLEKLEFTVSNETASNVHFRWVQHNTVASPAWAVDDIIINCSQVFLTISFEEVSSELVRRLECHSGSVQSAANDCSDTEFSLVLSGTERELRTTNLNLLNQMDNNNNEFYNTCAVTCPPLTAPGNGTMNCSSSDDGAHYVGDICTYTCDSGFVLNDTDNRKCQNDGSWNSTEPFCDQECTTNGYDVVFVLDISVSIQKNVLVGSIRNFTTRVVSFLDIGLTRSLVGLMYFAGDARVVFDLQQYRSKHTLTSALKEIDYPKERGTKYISILHLLNATAHSDSMGFRPDYPNIAIILTEGKSKDEPRTLRREAKKFHMEQLYQLFAVGIGNADQDQLDTITGDPSMVFLVDNLDEPALEQLEKNLSQQLCKNRISCPSLTAPNNGMIDCTGNMFEDTCTFSCDHGYELSGSKTLTCQSDQIWNGTDVMCTPVSCQQFTTAPNNGMINCTGNIFEDTCTFSCNQGYELSGSEKRTCQSNKFWNGTKAMCTKVSCPSLTAPNNGMIDCTGNMFEDTCTFSCDQGYELSGSETRTCQSNTTWNGTDVMCTPVSCQQLATAPNNGMIDCTGNMFEDTCTFSCDQGYELNGSENRTCRSDKIWSGTEAMCTKVSCPSLTAPNNGMIDCTGNMSEDTCTFSCDQGFELSGSEIWTCQSDQTWNGTDVMCMPGPNLSYGLVWQTTAANTTVEQDCYNIHQIFWCGLNATRKCSDNGTWSNVDITQCTVRERSSLILFSIYLATIDDACEIEKTDGLQLLQVVNTKDVTVRSTIDCSQQKDSGKRPTHQASSVQLAVFTNELNDFDLATLSDAVERVAKNYSSCQKDFGPPELIKLSSTGSCKCTVSSGDESLHIINISICVGPPVSPYNSTNSIECNAPCYAGDGSMCGYDEDQDGMPNEELLGCNLNISSDVKCQKDVCVYIPNPGANASACMPKNPVCQAETDKEFGIKWPGAFHDEPVMRCCPNGTGCASRLCNSSGIWEVANVKKCWSFVYQKLEEVSSLLVNSSGEALPGIAHRIQMDLAKLVMPGSYSIFPLDLKSVNVINRNILDAVENNMDTLNMDGFINTSVGLHSNLLHSSNKPGYLQLMEVNHTENQQLIVITERLGILLASDINSTIGNNSMKFKGKNLAISVEKRNASNLETVSYIGVENDAAIIIPASVIKERSETFGDKMVPIAHIEYTNIEDYLPRNLSMPNKGVPVSSVISSQVGNSTMPMSSDEPIILMLQHNAGNITGANISTLRCVFWNFTLTQNGVTGGWDTNNIVVVDVNDTFITCNSTHLTSFAVLVDVTGGTSKQRKEEATALNIVSYIGCSVSIVCSVIAIYLLLIYRNTILKGTHNFVCLNLAIALLLSLLVFVGGIKGGTYNNVVCTVVAALLHYLFTAVFSWMLCEGILLYVFLVKVFNLGFFTKKRLYCIIGWGIPIPFVAISVGIAHDHYGTDEFCWISTDDGAIWAFAGPMLLIVTVNIVILFMVLYVLYKTKSQKMRPYTAKRIAVVKSMLKATVVLLPLLGLTWVFGLLAVNKNTSVFAWLFTVLNSLQGLFLLGFHVIRNDKVKGRIKKIFGFKEPTATVIADRSPYMSKKVIREVTSKKTRNLHNGTQSVDKPDYNNFSEKEFNPQPGNEHHDVDIKVEGGQYHNENIKIQCTDV